MKILMICHDHPEVTDGGTEHAARDLCAALEAMEGVTCRFLGVSTSLGHPDVPPGTLHAQGRDLLLRTGGYDIFSMRRRDGVAWAASIERLLDAAAPDVVHLHGLDRIGADIIPLLRRLRPAARLVLTLHDFQIICPNEGLLLRRDGSLCRRPEPDACRRCFPDIAAGRHALRKARLLALLGGIDTFVAPSRDLRQRFVEWGLAAERIVVAPNAVPAMEAGAASVSRLRPNRFAYFGNIADHKGVGVLLSAAGRLARRGSDLQVTLHGRLNHPAPATRAAFADALAAAEPVAQFVGPYDRAELPDLMAGIDWVVLPSLWYENAPLVVSEARRARRPVISTGLGGLRELVRDGVDGLIVPRGDAATLAQRMEEVAGDRVLWSRLAANAPCPPDPETVARRHLELYAAAAEGVGA